MLQSKTPKPKTAFYVEAKNQVATRGIAMWELPENKGISIRCRALLSQNAAIIGTDLGLYLINPNKSGAIIKELSQQLAGVSELSFSPDRKFLATYSGYDGTVVLWGLKDNPSNPKYLATLKVFGKNEWALVDENGIFDCSPAAEKYIGWHVNEGPMEFATFHELDKFSKKFRSPSYLKLLFLSQDAKQAQRQSSILGSELGIKSQLGPKIEILSPLETELTQETSDQLKVTVAFKQRNNDSPGAIGLRINNRTTKHYRGPLSAKELSDGKYTFPVTLKPGRQKIQAEVYSTKTRNSTVSDRIVTAHFESILRQKEPGRKLFFMGVGIDNYKDHGKKRTYAPLSFCHSDVETIGGIFETRAKGAYSKSPEVKIFADLKSKFEFSKQLETMLEDEKGEPEFGETDTLVVMWSGHGDITSKGDFHLVLPECQAAAPGESSSLKKHGLSSSEMITQLRELAGQGNVILILDTCYSGSFLDDVKESQKTFASEANDDEFGIMVITAAGSLETSKEPKDLGMSNFAFLLKHGLLGEKEFKRGDRMTSFKNNSVLELDTGKIVTTDSLISFLKDNMSELVDSQVVQSNGVGGDIFLASLENQ